MDMFRGGKGDYSRSSKTFIENLDIRNETDIYSFFRLVSGKILFGLNQIKQVLQGLADRWPMWLTTLNTYIPMDIDSTHRNRGINPLPSDFVIPYTSGPNGMDALTASDPVSNAIPYVTDVTQAGSTFSNIVLSSNSSSLDNFYISNILDINGEYTTITNYTGSTQTATVNPPLTVAPVAGTTYRLRRGIPIFTGTLQAGSTENILIMPLTADPNNGFYVGTFVYFTSGADSELSRIIISYNGTTKQATLNIPLPTAPGMDNIEIDQFSYDNLYPLRYSGSRGLNQPVCYAIQLVEVTIPFLTLSVGYGGYITNYPYIYVHFYNEPSHSETTMYGNNPASDRATFKVLIDRSPPSSSTPSFVTLTNTSPTTPILIKFSPSESIRFRITLPNGENLAFTQSDTVSPLSPNPTVQISALVALKRIATIPSTENSF